MKKNKFTYKEYNANFKNKKTTDCVVRAISVALNKSWEDTFKELSAYTLETGYMWNDNGACGFKKFLKLKGYDKQKMPRRKDNTRYTVKEFIEELANKNSIYIISVAGHLTVVKNLTLIDIWDCSNKSVGNYWIIK